MIEALAVLYLAGTVLVGQLASVFAFFLCALPLAARLSPRRKRMWAVLAAVVVVLEGLKSFYPVSPLNPVLRLAAAVSAPENRPQGSFDDEKSMLVWLAKNGGGRPLAGPYGESTSVLAYAGLPVLLNPKFESRGVEAKSLEFLKALYSSEADLAAYCRHYGAGLLLYPSDAVLDQTPEGERYAAGAPALRRDTAAFLLQFEPQTLKDFSLLYQDETFRVYSVGPSTAAITGETPGVYDLAQFKPQSLPDGTVRLDIAGALARRQQARVQVMLARMLTSMGRREEALSAYETAFAAWPPTADLRNEEGRLRLSLERPR